MAHAIEASRTARRTKPLALGFLQRMHFGQRRFGFGFPPGLLDTLCRADVLQLPTCFQHRIRVNVTFDLKRRTRAT